MKTVIFLLLGIAAASAQVDIQHAYEVCREHRGPGTGRPGDALNWQKGWENCEHIMLEFNKRAEGQAAKERAEKELQDKINGIAEQLKKKP